MVGGRQQILKYRRGLRRGLCRGNGRPSAQRLCRTRSSLFRLSSPSGSRSDSESSVSDCGMAANKQESRAVCRDLAKFRISLRLCICSSMIESKKKHRDHDERLIPRVVPGPSRLGQTPQQGGPSRLGVIVSAASEARVQVREPVGPNQLFAFL